MKFISGRHKILLHLETLKDSSKGFERNKKAPHGLCQNGISEAIDLSQGRTSHLLKDLMEDGLIKEDVRRVVGYKRRRKVYTLTIDGLEKAREIQKELEKERVIIKKDSSESEVKLENIDSHVNSQNPLMFALNNINDDGEIYLNQEEREEEIFVGRNDEINFLLEKLNRVKNDTSLTILIKGKAGVGKTRLVTEFKKQAISDDFEFLTGKGHYSSSEPYLPFKEAFETYEEDFTPLKFSEGSEKEEKSSYQNFKEIESKRDLIFSETTKNIKKLARRRPIVVFIDDLQWADKATLMLFHYLSDRLEDVPVLLIGAARPQSDSGDDFFDGILQRMSKENLFEELELESLTWKDTKEIAQGLTGSFNIPDQFVQLVHETSEGNPLFSKEILREMLEDGTVDQKNNRFPTEKKDIDLPEVVGDIIERRIMRLNQDDLRVLQTGSIIGEEVPFSLLLSVTSMEAFDLLESIDILIGNGLWEGKPSEDIFYFSHGLIHKFVYDDIPDSLKKELHNRVGKSMEEEFEDDLEEYYSDIGFHYKQAEDFSKGFEYLKKAGKEAENVYAHEDAVEMYKEALELADKADMKEEKRNLLEKLGDLYIIIGRYDDSLKYYNRILKEKEGKGYFKRIYRKIANVYDRKGKFSKAKQFVEKGLEIEIEKNKETVRLLNKKGWTEMLQGNFESAKKEFSKALQKYEECERYRKKKDLADIHHALGTVYIHQTEFDSALDQLKKALNIRRELEDLNGQASSLSNLGNVYLHKGKIDKGLENFQKSLEIFKKIGDKGDIAKLLLNLGNVYLRKGDLEKVYSNYQKSYDLFDEIGDKRGVILSLNNLGYYYHMRGDIDTALDYYERSMEISKGKNLKNCLALGHNNLALIYQDKGEKDRAKEHCRKSIQLWEDIGDKLQLVYPLSLLAKILGEEGKFKEGIKKAQKSLNISKDIDAKLERGMCHRILGMIYREKDESNQAKNQFEKGEKILREAGLKIELAKLLFEYACLLRKIDKKEESEKNFNEARSMFEKMDMKLWLKRCEEKM